MGTQAKGRDGVCVKGTTVAGPGPFLRSFIYNLELWFSTLKLKLVSCTGWNPPIVVQLSVKGAQSTSLATNLGQPSGAAHLLSTHIPCSAEPLPHTSLKPVAGVIMILLCR